MAPIRFPLPVLAGLAALAALPAQAQTVDLGRITVLANLIATEIQRSGASVTVVERDEIDRSGAVQVGDLLARLPGVSLTQDGPIGTSATLRIRGADARYIAVYVDGIRIDDPSGITTSTDFGHLTLDDVDRIELLRGTQSALYGGSAVGGVINISTARPERDGFSQSAAAEVGSYGTAAARYTLAFRDARMESTLTLAHRQTRGFTAWEGLPGTPGFTPDAERDGFRSTRASGTFRYQASDTFAWGFAGFAQRSVNEYDGFMAPDADNESRRRQAGGRVFAEFDTGAMRHELSVSAIRISRREFETGAPAGQFTGRRTSLAYQGVADVAAGVTLIWGADTMLERAESAALSVGEGRMRTSGVFGQMLWQPVAALDISATARVDRNSAYGTFASGRLTAAWQLDNATTLRGAVARGFRPPSLSERFDDFGWFVGNPDLQPETSTSAEIGIDHALATGAELSATLFLLDTDNLITFDGSVSPNTLNNLPGISRRRGLEFAGRLPVGARVMLGAAYTYTSARTAAGARLSRVPRHDLTLTLDAELTDRLRGTLVAQRVAGRPADFGTPMGDYTVVGGNLRYAVTDRADIYLRVENLFDRQYQHTANFATPGRSFHAGVAARF